MRQGWGLSILEALAATAVTFYLIPVHAMPWIEKWDVIKRIPPLLLLPMLVIAFILLLAVRRGFESLRPEISGEVGNANFQPPRSPH
jgi:hypothetical protein